MINDNNEQQQRVYDFPYEPYDIQINLMNKLYESFEHGKISIIESPTGTGKSLSIICSLMKWLNDYKSKQLKFLEDKIKNLKKENQSLTEKSSNNNDWIQIQFEQMNNNNHITDLQNKFDKLQTHLQYAKELKKAKISNASKNMTKIAMKRDINELDNEDDFDDLIVNFDKDLFIDETPTLSNEYFQPKIYYCSRTHTQLSQFINEFKKTNYYKQSKHAATMLLPLSSRINYCINNRVNRFNNLNMINEKCNDLNQNSTRKCEYKNLKMNEFGAEILSNIYDIEEVRANGHQQSVCPYYSTKSVIPESEIVVMPYNILLHRKTREMFNIQLDDSIVIIDEAHNLLETISSVYSIEICLKQLKSLFKYLSLYTTKYYSRFNSLNLKFLKQLTFIIKNMIKYLENPSPKESHSMSPLDLSIKLNIENINIHELLQFIENSNISSKLHMFSKSKPSNSSNKIQKTSNMLEYLKKFNDKGSNTMKINDKESNTTNVASNTEEDDEYFNVNTIHLIKNFIASIIDYNIEAKILVQIDEKSGDNSAYKYLLLDSSEHFKDILLKCRSVVLCGGTMKPFDDYINQLYRPLQISVARQLYFSCNHIIDDNQLIVMSCSKGPSKQINLNYSYGSRNNDSLIKETALTLAGLVKHIPKGIVVFFPSYDYQELLLNKWKQMNLMKFFENKRIFCENRHQSSSTHVAKLLTNYKNYLKSAKNASSAILFAVIGGKISEGINFSDDYGRGVIVIGLPYANRNSMELMAKINHWNRIKANSGNDYYENLCMRAVNQSIGRAIRHRNDYAAIILIDERYKKSSINSKLSDWISKRFEHKEDFEQIQLKIEKFFKEKI